MADISRLSRLVTGVQRGVDLSSNTLVVDNLKIKLGTAFNVTFAGTPTADRTITMPDTDVDLGDIATNTTHSSGDGSDHQDVADLATLSGSAANSTNHGAFTGTTLSDTETTRSALQALETAHESSASSLTDHLDGGASKHDATEIDYERADGSKQDIQAASDDVELALTDLDDNKISRTGSIAFTGDQSMGGNKITSLGDPTAGTDAANKTYVDDQIQGMTWKEPVRVASTAAGTLASDFEDGDSVDGIVLATGDRILIKDQAAPAENGIYTVNASGAPTRATDMDAAGEFQSSAVFIAEGTAQEDCAFVCTSTVATVDTDAVNFVQFTKLGQVVAGAALTKSGNTLDVAVDDATIEVSGDALRVKADGINGTHIRLANDEFLRGRNNAGSADVNILKINTSDAIEFALFPQKSGTPTLDDELVNKKYVDDQLALQDDASEITYTPAVLTDWNGDADPGDANDALDQLAERVDDLEGGASGVTEVVAAGETLTAGNRAVRLAIDAASETVGRVYLADPTELSVSSKDPFHVIGLVVATGETAGTNVTITKAGSVTMTAHGFAIGEPVFLDSTGGLTATPPSTSGEANVKVGIAKDANTIEVQIQVMGVI